MENHCQGLCPCMSCINDRNTRSQNYDNEFELNTQLRAQITKLQADLAEAVSAVADYCDREEEIEQLEADANAMANGINGINLEDHGCTMCEYNRDNSDLDCDPCDTCDDGGDPDNFIASTAVAIAKKYLTPKGDDDGK